MKRKNLVIKLIVRNHPGVMARITGLFSRRAFNLEGILCGVIGDGTHSKMYLLVNNDDRLEQIIKQIQKLYDVLEVAILENYNEEAFSHIGEGEADIIPERHLRKVN
ncbi:acetolactate synthase small subunit [Fusibacter paucivorans]|uniref:Acetolactate synthase small subunit n=1 Tax=Fusibacter paucivorans TaxID=76009 RepID=A0ABS5PTV4_9FIRM|nr:acetolactate synthase small subunit [Fusibacter paucivorans]MBS7528605.1 acetolactate synthase small subunit [Fusibacter paucivorans]